jgi:hypothetical protein
MTVPDPLLPVLRNKGLASLGDAFVNFVYSLALTRVNNHPQATKVSDRVLAEAFRLAGLRDCLGTRVSRKDLANASEALLVHAYTRGVLTIDESVDILSKNPDGPSGGLPELLKLAAERIRKV